MENLPKRVSSSKPPKSYKSLRNSCKNLKETSVDLKTSASETPSAQSSPMSTRALCKSSNDEFDYKPLSFEKFSFNQPSNKNIRNKNEFIENNESLDLKTTKQAKLVDQYEISLESNLPTLDWCAYCVGERQFIQEFRPSNKTLLASIGIFLSGGIFGCFLLPYITPCCQTVYKKCTHCNRFTH